MYGFIVFSVYAIEGSAMAEQAKMVIKANNAQEKVTVIRGKVEVCFT